MYSWVIHIRLHSIPIKRYLQKWSNVNLMSVKLLWSEIIIGRGAETYTKGLELCLKSILEFSALIIFYEYIYVHNTAFVTRQSYFMHLEFRLERPASLYHWLHMHWHRSVSSYWITAFFLFWTCFFLVIIFYMQPKNLITMLSAPYILY